MMKTRFLIICLIAAAAAGCSRELPDGKETGAAELEVSFGTEVNETRGLPTGKESVINDVQILLFGAQDGRRNYYYRFNSTEVICKKSVMNGIAPGTYKCHIIANGPALENVTDLNGLLSTRLELGEVNDTIKGLMMAYHNDNLTITEGYNSLYAVMPRFVGKVLVSRIINGVSKSKIPNISTITIDRVFLTNVVASRPYGDGAVQNQKWYNKQGRVDENPQVESHIINGSGYSASSPDLTFCKVSKDILNGDTLELYHSFYGFENLSENEPDGFKSAFTPQRSAVVVVASFGGATYYYPVVLSGGSRIATNTSLHLELKILGPGSSDPNKPVPTSGVGTGIVVEKRVNGVNYIDEM